MEENKTNENIKKDFKKKSFNKKRRPNKKFANNEGKNANNIEKKNVNILENVLTIKSALSAKDAEALNSFTDAVHSA